MAGSEPTILHSCFSVYIASHLPTLNFLHCSSSLLMSLWGYPQSFLLTDLSKLILLVSLHSWVRYEYTHPSTDPCSTPHHPAPPSMVRKLVIYSCTLHVIFYAVTELYQGFPSCCCCLVSLKVFVKSLLETQSDREIRSPLSTFLLTLSETSERFV